MIKQELMAKRMQRQQQNKTKSQGGSRIGAASALSSTTTTTSALPDVVNSSLSMMRARNKEVLQTSDYSSSPSKNFTGIHGITNAQRFARRASKKLQLNSFDLRQNNGAVQVNGKLMMKNRAAHSQTPQLDNTMKVNDNGYIFDEQTMKQLMDGNYLRANQYGFKESPELIDFRRRVMNQELQKKFNKSVRNKRHSIALHTVEALDAKMQNRLAAVTKESHMKVINHHENFSIMNPEFFDQRKRRVQIMAKRFQNTLKAQMREQVEQRQLDSLRNQIENGKKFNMGELRDMGNAFKTPQIKNYILQQAIDSIKVSGNGQK